MVLRIDRAARVVYPWNQTWGGINFANLTAGVFFPFISESAAAGVGSVAFTHVPFPAAAGALRHLCVRLRSAALAVDSTYQIYVGGVITGMAVTIPAGGVKASLTLDVPVPLVAGGNVIHHQFTCSGPPGSSSTRAAIYVSGVIYG